MKKLITLLMSCVIHRQLFFVPRVLLGYSIVDYAFKGTPQVFN